MPKRMIRRKRGQIGMIETVFVIVVFFFLLGTGLSIYRRFAIRSDQVRANKALQMRSLRLAQTATTLPELQCSIGNVVQENCVDLYKANSMASILLDDLNARLYYYDTFRYANISVRQVFPTEHEYHIYENIPDEWTAKEVIQYPVIVHDPTDTRGSCLSLSGACNFGIIIVEAYR